MSTKENQNLFDFSNEPLIGWDGDLDILAERTMNIRPPTAIFKKLQHKNRINYFQQSKQQAYKRKQQVLANIGENKSHIDLLKIEVDHLDNQNVSKVKFPTYEALGKEELTSFKQKKTSTIYIDFQAEMKRIKYQSNSEIRKNKISLSIQGKSQNPSQNSTQSNFNCNGKKLRPQTCISQEGNLLQKSPMRKSWQTIHCKKDLKQPFQKYFQNKRMKTKSSKYRSSLSINQIEGTKLNKLISVIVDKNP